MSSTSLSSVAPALILLAAGAAGAYLLGFLPGAKAASTTFSKPDDSDEVSTDRELPDELPRGAWTKPLTKAEDLKGPIRVTQLWIHPIKSCRGTSVHEARYNPIGLENDRKWAIMDAKSRKILTARDLPTMVLIHPLMHPESTSSGVLRVKFPADSGLGFDIPLNPPTETLQKWELLGDVAIWHWSGVEGYICQSLPSSASSASPSEQLSTFLGRSVHLVMKGPRLRKSDPSWAFPALAAPVDFQDGYPLLLASEESLDASNERVHGMVGQKGVSDEWKEKKLNMQRFRPNIVLAGAGVPFAEDGFKHIVIIPAGSAGSERSDPISIVSKCTRCRLPNVDPTTAEVDTAVPFKVLMSFRTALAKEKGLFSKSCFGVNGAPTGEGIIRVGDKVEVTEWLNEEWK